MEDELMDMLRVELEKLHCCHPVNQPGIWDVAVDNIRAIRATIYTHQTQKTLKRVGG